MASSYAVVVQPRFWVTCYTDGSFREGCGGWGIYVRSEKGRFENWGACAECVQNALEAELTAIYAGVADTLLRWGPFVFGIAIFTDCKPAIDLINADTIKESTRNRNPGAIALIKDIRELVQLHGVRLRLVWVPGHQPGTAPRAYINRRCDELASRHYYLSKLKK